MRFEWESGRMRGGGEVRDGSDPLARKRGCGTSWWMDGRDLAHLAISKAKGIIRTEPERNDLIPRNCVSYPM